MSLRPSVAEIVSDHVTFELESIDRMYLNLYIPRLQSEPGIVGFFRGHRGHAFASSALMAPMSNAFVGSIHAFCDDNDIPIVAFKKGERKDDVAASHFTQFDGDEGVVFGGVAQEKTPVVRTQRRRNPRTGRSYAWLYRSTAMVNVYYFYCVDAHVEPFISPLLANVYLHRLDQEATKAGLRFVRYCDDFVVTANRRWKARRADQMIRELVADIALSLNDDKSGVRNLYRDDVEFLGFCFYAGRFLRPRRRAVASFKNQVRYLTRRTRGVSLQAVVNSLNPVIRGWGNYFSDGHVAELFERLDQWIRMRLRSFKRRRVAKPGLNWQMPTQVLKDMGLVSLVSLRKRQLSPAMG